MEKNLSTESLSENIMFQINVSKTNYFNIKFNYESSIESKSYHHFIERLAIKPYGEHKNLLIGSNIVQGQSRMSFGVSNIGDELTLKQPRFDLDLLTKVPFFRTNHFLNIYNVSSYIKGENSTVNIGLYKGLNNITMLVEKLELRSGQVYTLPIQF